VARQKSALGRGLSSLIEKRDEPGRVEILELDPASIFSGTEQPREYFDEKEIEALCESIDKHGILMPLIVSGNSDGNYTLVTGERRLRAARKLGLKRVPAIQKEFKGGVALEVALIENIQRQNLNPVEKARGFQRLIEDFTYTQEEVGRVLGKSRVYITNSLRLLALPDEIIRGLIEGKISEGHARALLMITDRAAQISLFYRVVSEEMTVRDVENHARGMTEVKKDKKSSGKKVYHELEKRLAERLSTNVSVTKGKRKGRIVIEFTSEEDLHNILGYFN
jgi:ParB family chromosome partitioning protein